ncbi:MAG: class I SAM-dependent methyltransferase [Anaerolineaceae bacterium]|nr:class I SAM-dependent methyltransferase [Anaerolineaceae bacterium]MBN2676569.1 class I SAM-dependent methyltransferase [Anaerolineaceae bacterium]
MEYITCPICGIDDTHILYNVPVLKYQVGKFEKDEWAIVKCNKCGLIYENPRIDPVTLKKYYDFEDTNDIEFINNWAINCGFNRILVWRRFIRVIKRFSDRGYLLDVGCGAGTFLVEAQKAGYKSIGQDVAPLFISYCRFHQNLEVYEKPLEELFLPNDEFDIVTAFDVIEHHPYPHLLLAEVHRILKPGGILCITTHDAGSFFARLYGRHWRYMIPIGHLTYFTKMTLTKLLTDNNFTIIESGGANVIDDSWLKEIRNFIIHFIKAIILRTIILVIYLPISKHVPSLQKLNVRFGNVKIDHSSIVNQAGDQIIMNDEIMVIAEKKQKK